MFPSPQIPGQGPSSPGALRVPPGPLETHPVNQPTLSSCNPPPERTSGAPRRFPISLSMKQFQPPAELRKIDDIRIAELPPLPEMSYDDYDADDESNNLSDLGGAEGKPPVNLKQTEFSLKKFVKRMGQANYSVFNKWKKAWMAGFHEKKHRASIRGQNRLKQVCDGPLHREAGVADCLETFKTWLLLDNFNNAEWICRQWLEMFLKICAREIQEARKKGRRGNTRPATDLGERPSNMARSNLPDLLNSMFMVVIRWVSNGKNMVLAPKQLQASYTDARHWAELIDFIDKNGGPKEPYIMTSMFKCTLE